MPAISPVSAADPRPEGEVLPLKVARVRRPTPRALWPEALAIAIRRLFEPLIHRLRRSRLYRQTLHGPMSDRIVFHPADPRLRKLDEADAMMRGRFRFAGQAMEIGEGSIFDYKLPGAEFAASLHGFDWLRHLEAAAGDASRALALRLTQDWLKRYARYALPAWQPEIAAERLFNIFAHGRFFLANSDLVWRSRLFVSLRNQARVLSRSAGEAPDGLPRLKAAAALALSGFCLADARHVSRGLGYLSAEIDRQILPDGGHVSRSPESLLEAFRMLAAVQQALDNAGHEAPVALRGALDRMAPMLRFFRMEDGALPLFNGGNEGEAALVSALLAGDRSESRPLGHAPNSGFQRLASGRTLVLLDAGCAPAGALSTGAHAGCLSFEMASGIHRVIVNCGAAVGRDFGWEIALRATAAHSTLTIDDTSQAMVLAGGAFARLLGPRLAGGASTVETKRTQGQHGLTVEATHDGYVDRFGVLHQRRMTLAPRGTALTGADRIVPVEAKLRARLAAGRGTQEGIPFAVRFHIHPDVRLSLSQAHGSVILKLPNGEGWRFRCGGGSLSIEESVYFGGGSLRRAEQLVIGGRIAGRPVEAAWVFEQAGAA